MLISLDLNPARSLLIAGTALLGLTAWHPPQAHAAPMPFSCDGTLYQGLSNPTDIQIINTATQTLDPAPFSLSPSKYINALGFNIQDGYVYGLSSTFGFSGGDGNIYRIGANGQIVSLGNPSNIPDTPLAGDVGAYGTYFVLEQNTFGTTNKLYKVNVSGATATLIGSAISLSPAPGILPDIAFNPIDQKLYGVNTTDGEVVQIDPNTGAVSFFTTTVPAGAGNQKGAAYFDAFGNFYAYDNTGKLYKYKLNTTNKTATGNIFATGPSVTFNDGFSCPYQVRLEKTVTGSGTSTDGTASTAAGTIVTYTYRISNPNTIAINSVTLSDTMANARTYVSGSLNNSLGGTPNAYGGTNSLSISGLTLPPQSITNVSIQVQVPLSTPASRLTSQAGLTNIPVGFGGPTSVSDYPPTRALGDVTPLDITASSNANLLFVARITAINGVAKTVYRDDTTSAHAADDNSPNWPLPLNTNTANGDTTISGFLRGEINAGNVKPGDTIEYTVYFLHAGAGDADNVKVCDRILGEQLFQSSSGISLAQNNGAPTALTSPRGVFHASVSTAATGCNFTNAPSTDNGAVVVNVTGAIGPTWSTLKGATAPGTTNSYGFIRFTTKVNL